MPTALSSTELTSTAHPAPGLVPAARRAVEDVGILFRFRAQAVRRRHLARALSLTFAAITVAVMVVPALLPGAYDPSGKSFDIFLLVPSAMAGILLLNVSSAIASGGGRELISRDQAAPYPISPTTDHLGALVLAPLNIAWMIQAWVLLGSVSFSSNPTYLVLAELVMVLWLVFSTALGQVVAWTMEAVRRGPHGIAISRGLLGCLALGAAAIQLTHQTLPMLDRVPTLWVFAGATNGWTLRWATTVAVLVAVRGVREAPTTSGALDWRRHLELCLDGLRPRTATAP